MFDGAPDTVDVGAVPVAPQAAPGDPNRFGVDALLRPWCRHRVGAMTVLVGLVYGDARGRFADGRLIRTSPLRAPELACEGRVAATGNSRYRLVGPEWRLEEVLAR